MTRNPADKGRQITTAEGTFTSTEFHPAEEKAAFVKWLKRFVKNGCPANSFRKSMYYYCMNIFGHIAHYDIGGYYEEWFSSPERIKAWLEWAVRADAVGDPSYCHSDVERAVKQWIAESGVLDRATQTCDARLEAAERMELARLKAKYEAA